MLLFLPLSALGAPKADEAVSGARTAKSAKNDDDRRPTALQAQSLNRKVLVLYDSATGATPEANLVHEGFQTPLNYYGLLPYFLDIQTQRLPEEAALAGTGGVITLFNQATLKNPKPYLSWLLRQIKSGRKVLILGQLGTPLAPGGDPEVLQLAQGIFRALGVEWTSAQGMDMRGFRYGQKAPGSMEFERKLPTLLPPVLDVLESRSTGIRPHLTLRHPARPNADLPVVFTSPAGGYAAEGFYYWYNGSTYKHKWYVNPFVFLEEAFGLKGWPAPDPTTLNGLRVAFSHVDADGFSGLSRIDGKSLCAEMLRDRIVKRFAYPITLSLIVAEVEPSIAPDPILAKKAQDVARELFRLSNVEAGSHTYSHPFFWNENSKTKVNYNDRFAYKLQGYTFNDAMEIDYANKYITALCPAGKTCRIVQWSGDCRPLERHIARADALGFVNINGGDTLFDNSNNSYMSVAPLYRAVGSRMQPYIGQSNDNILTNGLDGPLYGYRNIIETMKRTGTPLRLKPIDIYYHFFSAETAATLRALEEVYTWALSQPVALVFTTQYLDMLKDCATLALRRVSGDEYLVENYGHCLSLRFAPDTPAPDLKRCEGVLGYSRQKEGLFVSLAPGGKRARVVLSKEQHPAPSTVFLSEATGLVSEYKLHAKSLSLRFQGFGAAGRLALSGLRSGGEVQASGTALARQQTVKAGKSGTIELTGLKSGALELTLP